MNQTATSCFHEPLQIIGTNKHPLRGSTTLTTVLSGFDAWLKLRAGHSFDFAVTAVSYINWKPYSVSATRGRPRFGQQQIFHRQCCRGEQKLKNTGRVFPLTGLSGLLLIHFIMPEVRAVGCVRGMDPTWPQNQHQLKFQSGFEQTKILIRT